MLIPISNEVIQEVLKLQSVEEWRLGNYTKVDERIDKFRFHVSDLVMWAVMKEIHQLQWNKLAYVHK